MELAELQALAGHALPGGTFAVDAEENRKLCRILATEPDPAGNAHPLYAYIATQRAMGVAVDGLFELCGFSMADGPMLASTALEFARPLELGRTYTVTGRIAGVERKTGRKLGAFDLLSVALELIDGPARVAGATNVFVLPRGGQ
jgi:hydroxyacyl-ACP dehydratase HTD2-like protein with hotdog domain